MSPESLRAIAAGDRVGLRYTVRLAADGRVVDSNRGDAPLTITVGRAELLDKLDDALVGRRRGDRFRLELRAADGAFGGYDAEKVQRMPRDEFASGIELEVDSVIGFGLPDGTEVAGRVTELTDTTVTVDFNHPLLGHDVVYEVEIVEVSGDAA